MSSLHHQSQIMRLLGLGVGVLAVGFSGGFLAGARVGSPQALPAAVAAAAGIETPAPEGVDFTPVWKAWAVIDEKFVPASVASTTPVASSTAERDQARVWGMIEGLASSLNDPYTFFLPPVEQKQFTDDMNGSFQGVGMEIAVRDGNLMVVSPLKGTPAERAGIRTGDRILKIDGIDTRGMDVSSAVRRIRGEKGSVVVLLMQRDGWEEPKEVKVVREVINVPIVTTKRLPGGIFVIQVSTFTATAPNLFRDALRSFVESGDTKLIVDLRGNPGGYLEAAVDMASWFLPAGKVVVTEDYAGHADNVVHRSRGYDVFNDNLSMIVLVDKGSASASEIFADALRHYGKSRLIGSTTFGKGSVQELVTITDDTALKITVARWLGPSGAQIPNTGIAPDISVERTEKDLKDGTDPQMDKAVEILSKE